MDDCTLESGTLHVVPGSHLQNREPEGLLPHRCYPDEVSRFSCAEAVSEGDVVPCATKAGGVVFFSYGIAHSTRDNTSDAERGGIAYHCALPAGATQPAERRPADWPMGYRRAGTPSSASSSTSSALTKNRHPDRGRQDDTRHRAPN